NDYLKEWIPKRRPYLRVSIEREAPPLSGKCNNCPDNGSWRCLDCLGRPFLCMECCCTAHALLPLHRIERWTGKGFQPAWLWETGVVVNLEHGGAACQAGFRFEPSEVGSQWEEFDDTTLDTTEAEKDDFTKAPSHLNGHPVITVVDASGVHPLPFRFCRCSGFAADDIQLLRFGFIASSYLNIQTVFTDRVLDDFLLDNRECHTAAFDYFEKLRRRTSPAFPLKVKNRYSELLRVSRIWRNLKHWKWHGFGHSDTEPGEGDLALFCPACPQPGVNLPPSWEKERDRNPCLYTRSFVVDGNFVANHLKQKRPEDDVWLAEGTAMMTKREPYKEHLALVGDNEPKQKHDCNVTRALNAKVLQGGKDATGIGATACARHGFFCPTSVVDFQKGERQANVDYSFCRAVKATNMVGILRCVKIYDAMCKSAPHLLKRIGENKCLSELVPKGLTICKAIGSFHVHSHIKECYQRYGLMYMPGAGLVDGEILETLWSVLNHTSPHTRGATAAHRAEILDDKMNYSNWKKVTLLTKLLCQKRSKAITLLKKAEGAFESLSGSVQEARKREWTIGAELAQHNRHNDVKAMDWFAPKGVKDPHRVEVQLQLSKDSNPTSPRQNIIKVLSEGLHVQELQIGVQQFARKFGDRATTKQQLELRDKRIDLRTKIDNFHLQIFALMGVTEEHDDELWEDISGEDDDGWSIGGSEDDDDESEEDEPPLELVESSIVPEQDKIILPSSLGLTKCDKLGMADLRLVEIDLRCGQANEALDNIRLELGKRAFLAAEKRKTQKRYQTRSWAEMRSARAVIQKWTRIYRQTRVALLRLGATQTITSKYQALRKEHLDCSLTLHDTSISGQSHKNLPWLWGSESGKVIKGSDVMDEFLRVHWLRAQAQRDRAREEKILVEHEMQWTINYFQHRENQWTLLEQASQDKPGHQAYACRQQEMWRGLADQARETFQSLPGHSTASATQSVMATPAGH
ncbi:hypothetical protein BDN72DRAFT_774275, partial [Pluteus cervinus]